MSQSDGAGPLPLRAWEMLATARDEDAALRDLAAQQRTAADLDLPEDDRGLLLRLLAERDRAAAALDRAEAALDRYRASQYLLVSYQDDLTGALQRSVGRDRLADEVSRAHRSGGPLAVVFVDVDHLKEVNDRHGHAEGDALLRSVGEVLRADVRDYDVVVRWGGDEFVCAFPGMSAEEAGGRMAEVNDRLALRRPGASVGFGVTALRDDDTLDDALHRADSALSELRRARRAARPRRLTLPE